MATAVALLYQSDPASGQLFPDCPFSHFTGLHCPGCGSLRATHQLLHLQWLAALRLNPLFVLSLPVLGLAALGQGPVYRAFLHPRTPWVTAAILGAYWVLRNVPCAPFCYLAPH
jgi:hypothetical protein